MSPIRLGGLSSGLDTESIISQLMSVERAPRAHMTIQQARAQAQQKGLTDLGGKLRALGDAAQRLTSALTWHDAQTIEVEAPTKVGVRQLTTAAPGGHVISVSQLASADQHAYAFTPPADADTLTINGRAVALDAGATLDDAVRAINGDQTLGVVAIAVGSAGDPTSRSLVLVSRTTGTGGAFTASGNAIVEDPARAQAARDARYSVDGSPERTSQTNVVSDAIPGLELTLRAPVTATSVVVSAPAQDRSAVSDAVKGFIGAYNAAVDFMRSVTTEKPVTKPTSTFQAGVGALYGDSGIKALIDKLRSTVGQAFSGAGSLSRLSDIGISTGAATGGASTPDSLAGKLTLDDTALDAALDRDPEGVKALLGGAVAGGGLGQALQAVLAPHTQAGGLIDTRVNTANSTLRSINDRMSDFDRRMTQRESQMRQQFTAMESALSKLQSQGADLASRLARMPGSGY